MNSLKPNIILDVWPLSIGDLWKMIGLFIGQWCGLVEIEIPEVEGMEEKKYWSASHGRYGNRKRAEQVRSYSTLKWVGDEPWTLMEHLCSHVISLLCLAEQSWGDAYGC
jgi:hypothetical protein